MSQNAEILLEGSYLYYQNDVNYSQENFKLVHLTDEQSYHVYAEILSRMETGEFLKILVRFEMNQQYVPQFMRIEKSIGNKYAQEVFKVDTSAQELHYTFQNTQITQDYKRNITAKHHLASPAVSTSALFTLTKKFDASSRTPVILLGSDNEWGYLGPPTEKTIYAEYKNRDMVDFKLNNTSLPASHLCLYETDASHANSEGMVDMFLSKHYAIPYQVVQGEHKIIVKNLKRNN